MSEKQFSREIETKTTIRMDIEEVEAILRKHLGLPSATFEWATTEYGESVYSVSVISIVRAQSQEPSP